MTELEETKAKLEFETNLFSKFCELVEEDLGRAKVLYFLFMAEAKAIEHNELHEDERS